MNKDARPSVSESVQAHHGLLRPSGRNNPCPTCTRSKDGDCRISTDLVICHRGSTHHPPNGLKAGDVLDGHDGQRWAYTGESKDGRGAVFTLDKPRSNGSQQPIRPPRSRNCNTIELARLPQPITSTNRTFAYSPTQRVLRTDTATNKRCACEHHDGKRWRAGAGPDAWPAWHEAEAIEHGRGRWIIEAEGEKCAGIVLAAGVVAITQPGHAHKPEQIEPRYERLQAAGVAGVAFLADNDDAGAHRAEQASQAAAAIGMELLVLPAAEVWQGVPKGGSIDDAPGTAAEQIEALAAAIRTRSAKRRELPGKNSVRAPYCVLGWCTERSRIYYQHSQTGQIATIRPAAQPGPLLHLAPDSWWEEHHGREKGGIDWPAACSDVIEQANTAGVFAPERLRGRGVWMDGTAVVWHLGDRLEVDGQIVELIAHRSAHHYPRLPALDIDTSVQPLTDAEGAAILKAVSAMGWASKLDPIHLLGWINLANVGGALEKRPVLQITCSFGQGKTYTFTVVLDPLLAGLAISTSNSTEAGIRQTLGADTLSVLIDESEGEDPRRREGHLRLARLSYDGVNTSRGTTGGQALAYAVRSSIALAGINATIPNPADRSRAVVVGREQLPQAQWAPVDQRLRQLLTPQTGARLLRRIVTNLHTLRANVATFRRVVEGQLGSSAAARAGDTYGALLAGAHLLLSTALVDDSQAIAWLDSIGWSAAAALGEAGTEEQDATAESRQCLAHLLAHEELWRSDTGTGRISVRELIELARSASGADEAEQARKALGRRGIKATDMGLLIANPPEFLAPIYGSSKWRKGAHRARLRDLPGADSPSNAQRFPVIEMRRCTRVPWACID